MCVPAFTALCELGCLQAGPFRAGLYPVSISPQECLIQTARDVPAANCKGQALTSLLAGLLASRLALPIPPPQGTVIFLKGGLVIPLL